MAATFWLWTGELWATLLLLFCYLPRPASAY